MDQKEENIFKNEYAVTLKKTQTFSRKLIILVYGPRHKNITSEYGVLRKLKHIFPNTSQRIKAYAHLPRSGLVVTDLNTSPVVRWRGWETPPPQHRGSAVILCMTSSEVSGAGGRAITFILW